jgi:hypothetical protein
VTRRLSVGGLFGILESLTGKLSPRSSGMNSKVKFGEHIRVILNSNGDKRWHE